MLNKKYLKKRKRILHHINTSGMFSYLRWELCIWGWCVRHVPAHLVHVIFFQLPDWLCYIINQFMIVTLKLPSFDTYSRLKHQVVTKEQSPFYGYVSDNVFTQNIHPTPYVICRWNLHHTGNMLLQMLPTWQAMDIWHVDNTSEHYWDVTASAVGVYLTGQIEG